MLNLFLKRTILVRLFVMAFLFLFVFSNQKEAIFLMAASPTVTTSAASSISKTTATLNGVVSDNGGENITEAGFEYGLTASYGSSTTATTSYAYVSQFGSSGSGDGQFNSPYGITIDSSGNIYVSDRLNHRVQKFDSNGVYVSQFGSSGSGNGQFNDPRMISIDSLGNIYVIDTNNHRVQKFDSNGVYVSQFGSSGSGDGQFNNPIGINIDSGGNIYVTDTNNHRVQKFDSNGVYVSQFGSSGSGNGQFNQPIGIDFDSLGNIYVVDFSNNRVQKFDSNGVYVSQFGSSGSGDGQFSGPIDIFIDGNDFLYVSEFSLNDRVQKFDSAGVFVSKFGSIGVGNGQFISAAGLVLDSAGNIYVADLSNHRVQKFNLRIDPTQITGLTCGTTYHFRAYATNTDGTSYGNDATFTTTACEPPEVDTVSATSVGQSSATLNGLYVDMPFTGLTRGFEYGLTISYGQSVSESGNESVSSFGSAGSGNGAFNTPMGISLTPAEDALYIVDQANSRVQKLSTSGSHILNIVGNGIDFSSPSNAYVDTNGKVYVADVGNNRVQRFASDGTFELEIGTGLFGTKFTVAVDSSGNIFVADYDNALVAKFDSSGVFSENFADGQHSNPLSIDFDSSGNVYVGDGGFGTVRVFDSSGNYVTEIISDIAGVYNNYIYIDSADNLYVKDYDNGKLYKHDSSDTLVYTLLSAPGYFATVDSSGDIYVADTDNSNIDIYNLNFSLPVTSLGCEDTYHYRAFATNADGTGYGDAMTFSTASCGGGSGGPTTVYGCMDQEADNYNSNATQDDGSCIYFGCMDRDASNFDPTANVNIDDYCIYDPGAISGCTDPTAGNYDPDTTVDNGSCLYGVYGCMDPLALNYNEDAEYSDGSCQYEGSPPNPSSGCMDSSALNFNPGASVDDGSCNYTIPLVYGCTDITASNHNSSANEDDGSCLYINPPGENPVIEIVGEVFGGVTGVVKDIPKEILTGISVVGIVGPGLLLNFLQPGIWAGALVRLWNLIPILMGYKRKKRPWGTVFDSITKQPLDPVYVRLFDRLHQEKGTSITDIDGRYGFLAEAGSYTLSANKDNYVFPSVKLSGKTEDHLYDNLYFGGEINLAEKEGVIYKNIPMDAINFNWNEFAKAENKKLMKFYSKRDLFFARIAKTLFVTGLISSIILFLVDNSILNTVILSIYGLILLFRVFGVKPKQAGRAYDSDGTPLSFGIIRLFSAVLGREVAHTVIGKTGRYYMLVPNGEYYMKVSRKTGEDSYEDVLITDKFRVKSGYVREKIQI